MANFDYWDSAVLTNLANRDLLTRQEQEPTIGERIAPLKPVDSREVKVQVNNVEAFGKGQYRAPGATPPLVDFAAQREERIMELVLLDEMHRIKDEDWINLNSADDNIRKLAGVSLVDRGSALAIRNRRLTEALRWEAFSGTATITYPGDGSEVEIDYGIPQVSAVTAWSDRANSDPIAELEAWQELPAAAIGSYGTNIYMSSTTYKDILNNDKVSAYLTGTERPLLIPKREDLLALLREGTNIIVTDAGYRDIDAGIDRGINSLTRYLPEGKVLITTAPSIEGEPIADTPDGQVLVSSGYNQASIRRGPQAEVILDHISKTHLLRYASARIVRIHHPGAFVYADVS